LPTPPRVAPGRDPLDGELLGTRHTDRTVRGFDVTCPAPKSVSVLYAIGDDRFTSPDYRETFLYEAERLLPAKSWSKVGSSDNDPATRRR
jgi:hypothetical protein